MKSRTLLTLVGIAIYFVIKTLLGFYFPHLPYALVFDPARIWDQVQNVFQFTWLIHFYKTYWFESVLQLIAFGLITIYARSNRLILLAPFLTTIPMWLLAYYAPRSVHGSVFLNLTIFSAFALELRPKMQWAVIALLFVAYGTQLVLIANIKQNNSAALSKHVDTIVARLRTCPSPCTIPLENINSGLKGDWVMPELAYQPFIEWVARSHGFTQTLVVGQEAQP
jgi:hypothetical protein